MEISELKFFQNVLNNILEFNFSIIQSIFLMSSSMTIQQWRRGSYSVLVSSKSSFSFYKACKTVPIIISFNFSFKQI